jgi:1-acyl-sn-glycerol-3-phosphate acyltransferase
MTGGCLVCAIARLGLMAVLVIVLAPFQVVGLVASPWLRRWLPVFFFRRVIQIMGLHVVVHGAIAKEAPVLFVSNHASYLDIVVLGSLLPVSFVAKSGIVSWFLIGLLARLTRTVFIERDRRAAAIDQRDAIRARLESGDEIVLFPEGTSGDGNHVLPFKSALFDAASAPLAGRPVTVQPVSVAYTKLDGIPLGRNLRSLYAWYGGASFVPHFWRVLGLGRATVEVRFHPAVSWESFTSRKTLAEHCHRVVAEGLALSLAGCEAEEGASGADLRAAIGAGSGGGARLPRA